MKTFLTLLILLSMLTAYAETGINLYYSKCSTCHGSALALNKTRSEDQWKETIKRMEKHGLNISGSETKAIAKFLAERK